VQQGMTLAVLENPAETADVLDFENFLLKIEGLTTPEEILEITPPKSLILGELQSWYATFTLQYKDLVFFLNQKQAIRNINALKTQIEEIKNLNTELISQKRTLEAVNALDNKKVDRYTKLINDDKLVSSDQLEEAQIQALRSKRQLELLDSEVINNKLQIQRIEEKILTFQQSDKNSYSDKWLKLLEQVQHLKGQIALWKETYLLIAPISGQVTLPNIQNNHQFVKALDEVMYITPTNSNSGYVFGRANLPIPRAGKVEIGQDVKIRLLDYPYQEYGIVKGKVKDIALVPTTDRNGTASYYVEVDLVEGLATTYGDSTLTFRQGMQGVAQIITQDQSVLGNLFNKIWSQIWN
jgi:HlyD family secretion protein